ncbi:hypothetical protein [Acetatifactor aquisgranensis]|uniref:hypothetical protein n=1 Tax=Acetatifactor aquisgranensis TaxID=2941233 RepID=UPI002041C7EF|nr:hypothetical protein [Acetatifactor aquisgranensis]
MESRIREISAIRVTIGRAKLARDEKSVQKIFEVLEKCLIPCECMAINIDWLAIVIRKSEGGKINRFIAMLKEELDGTSIEVNGELRLLYIEQGHFTTRRIGIIVSSLSMQDIEINMQRYVRCEDRLVIGVSVEDVSRAHRIIRGILDADYRI